MKYVFTILFLIMIFQSTLASRMNLHMKNRWTKSSMFLNFAKKLNERKIRKLEGTDLSDLESGNSTSVAPPADDYTGNTNATGAETARATDKDADVDPNKPVSSKGFNSNKKGSKIQISKFHNFKAKKEDSKLTFSILLYFLRTIPYRVIFRLRVLYSSRLRNLEATAQSVRTDCVLSDENLEGTNSTSNINFNCEANKKAGYDIANVTLNTDTGMTLAAKDGTILENITFDDVNFNGNAAEEAASIQNNNVAIKEYGDLHAQKANISFEGNTLKIKGTLIKTTVSTLRRLTFSDGKFNMHFEDGTNSGDYACTLAVVTDPIYELNCDTSGSSIDPTYANVDSSQGNVTNGDGIDLLNVYVDDYTTDKIKAGSSDTNQNSKSSSSGLSGGAIAGIVIACVVVLVGVTVAIIMLRKPKPPIDNTAVAELKTDNI